MTRSEPRDSVDEILAELQRIKNEHAARFRYDVRAMCADLARGEATANEKKSTSDKPSNPKKEAA